MKKLFLALISSLLILSCGQQAKETRKDEFVTLENAAGMVVKLTNFGGRIVSVVLPDKDGVKRDVVLGFDTIEEYYPENNQTDFGAIIGRYANRINQGKFSLDGVEYDLPKNNYGHCLHGGPNGWQYKSFEIVSSDKTSVKFKVESPDGDANFPGAVTVFVTYKLTENNTISIDYEGTTTKPTIINMTNHAYFNLSGDPANYSIENDVLYLNASAYTPVDDTFMTTGEILPVEGTPMDFRAPKLIADGINQEFEQLANGKGYDHNWVLDTKGDVKQVAASLYCPQTGIKLSVYTSEPGIQVYSGNFLDGTVSGKGGVKYDFRHAICLETQHYPDSPNKADWPSVVLRPGETYRSHCSYQFSVE